MGNKGPTSPVRASLLALATVVAGGALIGLSAPSRATDDYPYAGQGQCPIASTPTPPTPKPTPAAQPGPKAPHGHGDPTGPGHPGVHDNGGANPHPGKPTPSTPPTPKPTPVLDPVSGHEYFPPGPKPECTRRVWVVDGSLGDPWGFALRNCTSFVAWRLRETNGLSDFVNDFHGQHWGDANHWDDAARALGYRVDGVPAVGAVAQTDDGRVGHVAWVESVGTDSVTVEEYNHLVPGGYDVRTVPTGDFTYLHVEDVAPAPYLGTARPIVSVPTGRGESWTARLTADGDLHVASPGGREHRIGRPGTLSTDGAPALALDWRGAPWVAVADRAGRVLVSHADRRGHWSPFRAVAATAHTSSPALVTDPRGHVRLTTVTPDGELVSRTWLGTRWTPRHVLGSASSWGVHTAPVMTVDAQDRLWLAAVRRDGALVVRHTGGDAWSGPTVLPGPRLSITSTPALSTDGSGRLWLHAVTDSGSLVARSLWGTRWGRPQTISGAWSAYSSPAVTNVAGRLWLAAVDTAGRTLLLPALPVTAGQATSRTTAAAGTPSEAAARSTHTPRGTAGSDVTRSPAFLVRAHGAVYLLPGTDAAKRFATFLARTVVPARGLGRISDASTS